MSNYQKSAKNRIGKHIFKACWGKTEEYLAAKQKDNNKRMVSQLSRVCGLHNSSMVQITWRSERREEIKCISCVLNPGGH